MRNSGLKAIENSRPLYMTGNDSLASPTSGVVATMSMLLFEKMSLTELDFSAFFTDRRRVSGGLNLAPAIEAGMDKEHKILLDALGFDPVDLDKLVVRTGFKPEAVSSMMLILELEGHVQAAPGGRYSRVANRRAGGER